MARASIQDIKVVINRLNRIFQEGGFQIVLEGRYNYSAIELYDLEGSHLKTLKTGMSKKEVMLVLDGMDIGADLIEQTIN